MRGLFIPDEGRYAEIPREMLATGDWVTPRQNDLKYFEKPPLQYWMTAATYKAFGLDEWTARLSSTLLGFLAVLMVGFTGHRIFDPRTGLFAMAFLGGSWAFFLGSQYLTLDMTLTACLTFSLCAFLLAQGTGETPPVRGWMVVSWMAAALAILSKGLIGIVLPALALIVYCGLRRDASLFRRLHPVSGATMLLLLAAPWFIVVQSRNPEFFQFFFIHEHFQRFAESGHNRPGPWWYYLPILFMGLMPWTPAVLKMIFEGRPAAAKRAGPFSAEVFCIVWSSVIVAFFSLSHSKLPAYVLPAFPAIALVVAHRVQGREPVHIRWSALGIVLTGVILMVLIGWLPRSAKFTALGNEARVQMIWLYCATIVLVISGIAALWRLRRGQVATGAVLLLLGTFGFWQFIFCFLHGVDSSLSSERLIDQLTRGRRPFHLEAPFYSVAHYDESVPFYLGRPVTLVDTIGELGPGIAAEPGKYIPTIQQFSATWLKQTGQAYAIMHPGTRDALRRAGVPMTDVASSERLIVVGRIPEGTGHASCLASACGGEGRPGGASRAGNPGNPGNTGSGRP